MSGDIKNFDIIPHDIYFRHYSSLRNIAKDNARPERRQSPIVNVYWGVSGSGKTHRSFDEIESSGEPYYRKNPLTKWWDGYNGEELVVIDEFAGIIGITHLLQWLDKYPVSVEIKGSQVPLRAYKFWITSNIDPKEWYNQEGVTQTQREALQRRLTNVIHFPFPYGHPFNPIVPNEPLETPSSPSTVDIELVNGLNEADDFFSLFE